MTKTSPARRPWRLTPSFLGAFSLVAGVALAAPPTGGSEPVAASPADAFTFATASVADILNMEGHVVTLVDIAKKQKDIIKVNCVSDKLLQIRGHRSVADGAIANLNDAKAKGDLDGSNHELSRVRILQQKVMTLNTEAENCIGQDLNYVGLTTVKLEIAPNIPSQDITATDFPALDTSRLPAASPLGPI